VYAIIKGGGHQLRVAAGDTIEGEKLDAEPGSGVALGEVLMVSNSNGVQIRAPFVSGAKVLARVLSHGKGEKLIVFKFKPKKRYRRKTGHRQNLTRLAIKEIRA